MMRDDHDDLRDVERITRERTLLETREHSPDCLSEDDVAGFVDGGVEEPQRARVLAHLARCDRCASAVQEVAAMVADDSITREIPAVRRRRIWTRGGIGAAMAAAATLVFLLAQPRDGSRNDDLQLREPAITAAVAPVGLSPRDSVARVDRLVWTSVSGAQRYHVRVQRADGALLWSALTADTTIQLPDSVRLAAGTYFWRVDAETEWRRRISSDLTRFVIRDAVP